jgi:predicted Zn-dependent peptidase
MFKQNFLKKLFVLGIWASTLCLPHYSKAQTQTVTEGNYTYQTVQGDPTKARIYTLKNGLRVYMTVYKNAPRIQTYIAVRAGSKHDPADATGLAHYLEHMVFKGTTQFGTSDWASEKPLLDKIEQLFETYRRTKDEAKRKEIYAEIDKISNQASKFAIGNEYDQMLGAIGATGTNAYTWFEQTVYMNDIPSNQLEKWLKIESNRFTDMVPRIFHTELEAVYEEKNISLDSDESRVSELMFATLFPNHQYGTQTTIGTIEHLKNPSLTEIKKYFNTYYVPNNMAICLSGDLDPAETIALIDKYFGGMTPKPVPAFSVKAEPLLTKVIEKEVFGPDAENLRIGFRLPAYNTREMQLATMLDMVLSNSQAGLIDLNLNQTQKVQRAYSYVYRLKDYGVHFLGGRAKEGQKLEEVKDLLLEQLELVKQGKFEDWLLPAILNDLKKSKMLSLESNAARADAFVNAFIYGMEWQDVVNELNELSTITKDELVQFVNRYYAQNYVVVYKRKGEKNSLKVDKPAITPVDLNRDKRSAFAKSILETEAKKISPVFLDYTKDLTTKDLSGKNVQILYKKNTENGLFFMNYVLEMGTLHNKKLGLAVDYLNYLGDNKYAAQEFKKELYKLGCSFSVFSGSERVYVSLSGLNENFEKALVLFENLLANAKPDQEAYDDLVKRILKSRKDNKLNKSIILRVGLQNYAQYGEKNPFNDIISESELKAINPKELTDIVKNMLQYPHKVLYYGGESIENLSKILQKHHKLPKKFLAIPAPREYKQLPITENKVYWTEYDMVQAEILTLTEGIKFNKELSPTIQLFNEYFGGGMGSVVFQEIRESKALAYSSYAFFGEPNDLKKQSYFVSYIGTQADKLADALAAMDNIVNNIPAGDKQFANAKSQLISNLETQRITKSEILFDYINKQKLGLTEDPRKNAYNKIPNLKWDDILAFQQKYIKGKPRITLVVGKKDRLDFEALKKYGKVEQVSLEKLFGY